MKRPTDALAPMNCIDKALLALDSADERIVLHWVLATGAVDEIRLRAALMAAAARRPELRSTIRSSLLCQQRQIRNDSEHNPLTVRNLLSPRGENGGDSDVTATLCHRRLCEWMNRPLDPTSEFPWRVMLLRKTLTESVLVFSFHHSATDGLGAIDIIADVIRTYNGLAKDPPPSTPEDACDELVALARAYKPAVVNFHRKMMASLFYRFVIAPSSPNSRVRRATTRPSAEVDFCQGSLSQHELKQLKLRAKTSGATLNDVLLSACFKTVEIWNDVHGIPSRRISLMVPVDLSRQSPTPPRGNRVSFISLSTSRKERANAEKLLRCVSARTSRMLADGIAFSVLYAVYFCCRLPPQFPKLIARFLLATRIYLDSVLMTNLGLIWPAEDSRGEGVNGMGDEPIASVLVIPPVVSPMGISFSAVTYDGHLNFSLTYKTQQFSEAEAKTFLNLYLHELRSYQRTREGLLAPETRLAGERERLRV